MSGPDDETNPRIQPFPADAEPDDGPKLALDPELEARIRAVMRRSGGGSGEARRTLRVGGIEIDVRARRTTLDGEELDLSPREFDLLVYLVERAGDVVTKRELLTDVWQQAYGGSDKTVDVHISWLRRKLGESATSPRYLHTVRGVGVRLAAPEE